MKMEYVKLTNYAGLKRGSGLSTIEIDFTKQRHNICLIIGKNKSGKTTLMNALHPLPDNNTCFIEGKPGQKTIRYITESGPILIDIIHPIDKKGNRMITKAFIKRYMNGEFIELNPNGNIGSYKSTIESVFGLDPSFLALASLSSENRGLVDKTPSDRKKFVTNILENLEVFNNIGRTMSKRVGNLRTMVNQITSKIDSIGSEEQLQASLQNVSSRIASLDNTRDSLIGEKSKYTTMVDNIDPDRSIMEKYNANIDELCDINNSIEDKETRLKGVIPYDSLDTVKSSIENTIDKLDEEKNQLDKELFVINSELPRLLAEHSEESRSIELKNGRLISLKSEGNYEELKKRYKTTIEQIRQCEELFKEMNVIDPYNISKDEYILGMNIIGEIKQHISSISSSIYRSHLMIALESVLHGRNIRQELMTLKNKRESLKDARVQYSNSIIKLESDVDRTKILDKRPELCNIDTCAFIADALAIYKTNPNKKLEEVKERIMNIDKELDDLSERIDELDIIYEASDYLRIIKKSIESNKNLILKLPYGEKFVNLEYLVKCVLDGDDFHIMDEIYKTIVHANMFDIYRLAKQNESSLLSDLKIFESKNVVIDELEKDISELNSKLDSTYERLNTMQTEAHNKRVLLDTNEDNRKKIFAISAMYESIVNDYERRYELEKELSKINVNTSKLQEYLVSINLCQDRINEVTKELQILRQEKDKISYSVKMLYKYREELALYQNKYRISDIIRKHSVPQSGVQLVFIRIFMGQTIDITNELLEYFFDGDIQLLPEYTINEHEFKLPCYDIPSGITNDDVSNCSTSEKCMLGLLMSYALLRQASTEYDILRLDEIDSGLDSTNRMKLLENIEKLQIPQCFLISHSSEADLSSVDIIQLTPQKMQINNVSGNVIFSID